MRRDSREAVYKILFARSFKGIEDENFVSDVFGESALNEKDKAYAEKLISDIDENREKIEQTIGDRASGYEFSRLFVSDRCAMTIAVAEMLSGDVPAVVAIDEALFLVRKYSTEDSINFVNGVLAGVKKEIFGDENN